MTPGAAAALAFANGIRGPLPERNQRNGSCASIRACFLQEPLRVPAGESATLERCTKNGAVGPRNRQDYRLRKRVAKASRKGASNATKQTERHREAAEHALGQLDWCIGYLHGIRKQQISAQLAKNRAYIRRRLMREAERAVAIPKHARILKRASRSEARRSR